MFVKRYIVLGVLTVTYLMPIFSMEEEKQIHFVETAGKEKDTGDAATELDKKAAELLAEGLSITAELSTQLVLVGESKERSLRFLQELNQFLALDTEQKYQDMSLLVIKIAYKALPSAESVELLKNAALYKNFKATLGPKTLTSLFQYLIAKVSSSIQGIVVSLKIQEKAALNLSAERLVRLLDKQLQEQLDKLLQQKEYYFGLKATINYFGYKIPAALLPALEAFRLTEDARIAKFLIQEIKLEQETVFSLILSLVQEGIMTITAEDLEFAQFCGLDDLV